MTNQLAPKPRRPSGKAKKSPGFPARKRALTLISKVLDEHQPLEHLLDRDDKDPLAANDRALARAIAATTLRRRFQIDKVLTNRMEKSLGKRGGSAMHIMRVALAQILFMDVPDHASVSLAMDLAKADQKARHFSKLINGVLRGITREKDEIISTLKATNILPEWLHQSWRMAYGPDTTSAMAAALCHEPYLDITVKSDAEHWTKTVDGVLTPTGTIRLKARGSVNELPGFSDGAWWVQDAAASLAPRLLGDVADQTVADLCAAPGGKTAYLAAHGARVTAVDISSPRLKKLHENLKRLNLKADIIKTDIMAWEPNKKFDALLLDAPCSATGTIRKHPDILSLKSSAQVSQMAHLQRALLKKATSFVKDGGTLVFCTCSLQPEEGEATLDFVKEENLPLRVDPVTPDEVGGMADIVQQDGTVRTLPHHRPASLAEKEPLFQGLDGFFIARFTVTGP